MSTKENAGRLDRCKAAECPDYRAYPDGSSICLRYGWEYPGINWICPDGLQKGQLKPRLPQSLRVHLLTVQVLGRHGGSIQCHKCGKPIEVNHLVVSRRVGTGGGNGAETKGNAGPTVHSVLYHYKCAQEVNLI